MNADGSEPQRVVTGTDHDSTPHWSPDGDELVFTRRMAEGGSHLYRIRPDGTGLTRISYPPSPVVHYDRWRPIPGVTATRT